MAETVEKLVGEQQDCGLVYPEWQARPWYSRLALP